MVSSGCSPRYIGSAGAAKTTSVRACYSALSSRTPKPAAARIALIAASIAGSTACLKEYAGSSSSYNREARRARSCSRGVHDHVTDTHHGPLFEEILLDLDTHALPQRFPNAGGKLLLLRTRERSVPLDTVSASRARTWPRALRM